MKDNYSIYYNNTIDIKIICYLIRFYLEHDKKYKTILKYFKNNNILNKYNNKYIIIYINNHNYILFDYNKNNINYNFLNKYSIDSDEFNNEIINNTSLFILYKNNKYLINNV
jgi:hypothetical protein